MFYRTLSLVKRTPYVNCVTFSICYGKIYSRALVLGTRPYVRSQIERASYKTLSFPFTYQCKVLKYHNKSFGSNDIFRDLGGSIRFQGGGHSRVVCSAAAAEDRQILVQHIVVDVAETAKLDAAAQLLEDGMDFGEVAEGHSKCPSRKQGGLIGWISPGRTAHEFEAAAFAAPLGKVVRCETKFGAHLLKVVDQRSAGAVQQMSPSQLKLILDAGEAEAQNHQWVDVREPHELATSALPNFRPYPLSSFSEWAPAISQTLDPSKSTLVLCHHGVRSMQASEYLVSQGFNKVKNISGGIDMYSAEADPSVPRY